MGLRGGIIKTAVELSQTLSFSEDSSTIQQSEQLLELLKKAKDTAFGKFYGFEDIIASQDPLKNFQKEVPIHSYQRMSFWWEQQQKHRDISWPGKPDYFALSSGTTGSESKRIPITKDFGDSMRKVGISLTKSLPNFDLPESVFESDVLMLSSSAKLHDNPNGFLEGEISGINVHRFPDWYELFYRPGKEIASIDNWDKRVKAIAEKAKEWDIGAIAGIPSWVLLMIKKVLEYHDEQYIQDVWPNFKVYVTGGVSYETYKKDFDAISKEPLVIMDTYLASEGFFAYTCRPNTMNMRLALSHGYFYEFIPFNEKGVDEYGEILDQPEILSISEVEKNKEYVLVISSCAGAWRYVIGDTIKITSKDPVEIKISGRTKFFLNVVGSQLSEEKLDESIVELSEKLGISINEYIVGAIKENGDYKHQWVLVTDSKLDNEVVKNQIDDILKKKNKNYKVARSKALKGLNVLICSKSKYKGYLEKTKKAGGQVKTPKVMKEEQLKELLDYLD